jgi:phage-related minor tail protein
MTANKEVRVTFRGIDKTREAFGKIKQNFKQLQGQLSKIKLGFGKIGGALTAAFGTAALKKIIDSGAEIGRLSAKLDISTQNLSELKYAASKCGVEFETLTSAMGEMASRTAQGTKGTGEAAEALRLLGLSAKELNEVAPNEQLALIAEQLIRVTDSADRSQLAIKLFGREGANLLPLLEQGASGIKKFQNEARKLGVSLSSEDCAAMTKFNEELAKLQAVLTGLITSVLVPILPVITAFFAAIRDGHPIITFIITAVSTLLTLRLAAWFFGATTAVRAFTIALAANPLGAVAVAISTAVAALVTLTKWFKKSTEVTEEYNQALAKTQEISSITIPKQSLEVLSKRNELQFEAKRIFEQTRTPLEKHNLEVEKLNKLLKQGLIDQDTYNRAMKQSSE